MSGSFGMDGVHLTHVADLDRLPDRLRFAAELGLQVSLTLTPAMARLLAARLDPRPGAVSDGVVLL